MPQPRPALLGRQGFARPAAARRKGVSPRRAFPFRCCTSTPATTFPKSSRSATGARPSSASGSSCARSRIRSRAVASCFATRPRAATPHQSVTLLDAIAEFGFDACIGGARRDEEKARAKERIFSFRDAHRPVGSQEPAAGAVEPLQRAHARRARTSASSRSPTGPSSTSGNTSRASASRCRRSTLRTRARSSAGDRRWSRSPSSRRRATARSSSTFPCAFAPSATSPARRPSPRRRRRSRRSSPRRRPTTITERGATRLDDQTTTRRWSCARRRDTSDVGPGERGPCSTTACCGS